MTRNAFVGVVMAAVCGALGCAGATGGTDGASGSSGGTAGCTNTTKDSATAFALGATVSGTVCDTPSRYYWKVEGGPFTSADRFRAVTKVTGLSGSSYVDFRVSYIGDETYSFNMVNTSNGSLTQSESESTMTDLQAVSSSNTTDALWVIVHASLASGASANVEFTLTEEL
jgi:hypothetical protein